MAAEVEVEQQGTLLVRTGASKRYGRRPLIRQLPAQAAVVVHLDHLARLQVLVVVMAAAVAAVTQLAEWERQESWSSRIHPYLWRCQPPQLQASTSSGEGSSA